MACWNFVVGAVSLMLLLSMQHGAHGLHGQIWRELSDRYGDQGVYLGLRLGLRFNSENVDSQLQLLQNSGDLQNYCPEDEIQRDRACAPNSRADSILIQKISAILSRTCCSTSVVVNGAWGEWTTVVACSVSCGDGIQTRTRQCNNPSPANGGSNCVGSGFTIQPCNTVQCPVDGQWGEWTTWTTCSASCGGGLQTHTRQCNNPSPANGGQACVGLNTGSRTCNSQSCDVPVNGAWGEWTTVVACSVSCGGGTQTRTRQCNNPSPANGGSNCVGSGFTTQPCNTDQCPVDGQWGEWTTWTTCSASCGGGIQTHTRQCNNPSPANGGQACVGLNTGSRTCNNQSCDVVVNGAWGEWTTMTGCTTTCGGGIQIRTRQCNNPSPANGGSNCVGSGFTTQPCNTDQCPMNGQWGEWTTWTTCSASCGGGIQTHTRQCNNTSSTNSGQACVGLNTGSRTCNNQSCDDVRTCSRIGTTGRIIGGQDATRGQYPWLVHVLLNDIIQCGGEILDENTILTAGHCVNRFVEGNVVTKTGISIIAGQFVRQITPLETGAQFRRVVSGIRHPSFIARYFLNDVAVLKLDSPLQFNDVVSAVCLGEKTDALPKICVAAGWGYLAFDTTRLPEVLQHVSLNVYNNVDCLATFKDTFVGLSRYLMDGVTCAANGLTGGRDTCRGDSGSGLMCEFTDSQGSFFKLMGLVSSGKGCGDAGNPGLYTNVPYYVDWIRQTWQSLASRPNTVQTA